MKTLITILSFICIAQFSQAQSAETWTGPGEIFNMKGESLQTYNLVVKNTPQENGTILSEVKIDLPDGSIINQKCDITHGQNGWSTVCENSSGGGRCYGEGLCQSYTVDGDKAFATTIVMDGENSMRLLRTELHNGEAVRIFREKLNKN